MVQHCHWCVPGSTSRLNLVPACAIASAAIGKRYLQWPQVFEIPIACMLWGHLLCCTMVILFRTDPHLVAQNSGSSFVWL